MSAADPAGSTFTLAGFTGRREWYGYKFTQVFRDPENGRQYVVSLLWFATDNTGRVEGPIPDGHAKGAANVPLPVVYYACGQVQALMREIEAMGTATPAEEALPSDVAIVMTDPA
jgi:hypothetical protein